MMLSSAATCFSAAPAETAAFSSETSAKISETALTGSDEVLTEQNIALYPNGVEAEQVITLNGLMPRGATAEAVDVSEQHEGVSAYDITISSGEEEYQPGEANPIRVEISDPAISDSVYIELWHIADDGTRERITEFSITDNIISFEATAFSVYEIVTAPEPLPDGTTTAQTVGELDGKGFFISNKDGNNSYYCTGQITDYDDNGTIIKVIKKTAKNDMDNAAVWYFNKNDDNKYLIYTLLGEEKVYMKMTTDGNRGVMALVPEADATAFDVTLNTNNNIKGFYISSMGRNLNMFGGANGTGFAGWHQQNGGSKMILTYPPVIVNDPANLDGKSYALIMTKLARPTALMADDCPNYTDRRMAVEAMLRNNPFISGTNLIQMTNSDLTLWTFENISGSKYYITTQTDDGTKYLRISGTSVELADTPDDDCVLTVQQGTGEYSGMIHIANSAGQSINQYSKDIKNGFGGYKTEYKENEWLSLAQLSVITDDDFVTNTAQKISVSDIRDGQQVIVYTRVWDEDEERYKFYIVDYEGNLVPAYEIGENLEWYGLKISTLLWEFTEYKYPDGTPNYYYELQNTYSGNYLAPQIKDRKIISPETVGINLSGRKNGGYYSTILAWDKTYYQYAALKVEDDHIASVPKSKAGDFYFAVIEPPESELTTVNTINNADYGISMKMINYGNVNSSNRSQDQYDVIANNSYTAGPNPVKGILERWIDENADYPLVTSNGNSASTEENPISLSRLFNGAYEVDNLFLENTHNESGYFEYDCTNNYAYLDPNTHKFKVYDQVATIEVDKGTSNIEPYYHGQFLPYNDLVPNRFSALPNKTDALGITLPADDPRHDKKLYSFPKNEADYFFGMEIEAGFTQTADGLDSWDNPMIFEFTGDDDFWLYVDDVLVIDLGGIHDALGGTVNFKTGKVQLLGKKSNQSFIIENTTLKELFEEVYREKNPSATDADVQAYLEGIFVTKTEEIEQEDGTVQTTTVDRFKDYSNHKMKIFYMERGAGASNLHLRFNLAAVKPGQVRLSKEVSTDNKELALDYQLVEFPFQIYYRLPSGTEFTTLKPGGTDTDFVGVYIKDPKDQVTYKPSYTPPGGTKEYSDVFFLSAGESAYIDFPDDTIEYYITECGVECGEQNSIYDKVKINGEEATGTAVGLDRKDYSCDQKEVGERPAVTFDNHIKGDGIRDLTFTKELYAEDGAKIHDDTTTFDFRLYISAESVELEKLPSDQRQKYYADMHKYHVISPEDKYCKWDPSSGRFVETTHGSLEGLTEAQLEELTFFTSPNGAISKIPAWHKVQVVDLPVGTKFRVDEFFSETPLGYNLKGYARDQNSYIADPNDPENIGIVREASNPAMIVKNERGLGISAEKIWADKYVASEHEPVYFALYEKNGTSETMVSNTIKQLKYPNTTVKWYLSSSYGDLSNYVVRELKTLSQPLFVDEDGNVKTYSGTAIPLGEGATDTLMVGARNTGSTQMKNKEYYVTYENGEIKSTANNDEGKPLKNTREDKVTNTPAEKGVKIRLSEWNGTEADRTFKAALADGAFTLKLNGDEIDFGEYISDENGTVAVLYDYKKGENNVYTLTQTAATITWVGTDTPINFYIEETAEGDRIRIINPEDDGWVNHKDITSKELIGEITVYNKKLSLSMIKYASGSDTPLAKAEFSLYRGTKQSDGSYLQNYYPLADYESLVTGADGIIPKINETLPSSRYFLKEVRAPNGYERFVDPIEFNITKLGEVELINKPQGVSLVSDTSEEGKVIVRIKAGNNLKGVHVADLTVKKKVEGLFGDKTKRFEFKLEVMNSAEESFTWLLNGEEQEGIRSGDTFTLADGDTAVFTLPLECDVTITETEEDYTASMKLDETDKGDTNSVTFEFLAASELLVTNARNGILPTGIPGSLCKALLLFLVPTVPIGAILYSKRKKKRTA